MQERANKKGLQQEIAVLDGRKCSPNVLVSQGHLRRGQGCLSRARTRCRGRALQLHRHEAEAIEAGTRKLFTQLIQGINTLSRYAVSAVRIAFPLTSQHDRNIVHRDIKPENILMVDRDLHVKLADFGLAKIIGEESFTTTLCGTAKLRGTGDPGGHQAAEVHQGRRHMVTGCRYVHLSLWLPAVLRRALQQGFPLYPVTTDQERSV